MQTLATNDRTQCAANHEPASPRLCPAYLKVLPLLLLLSAMLSGCGGGSPVGVVQNPLTLTGNWQFTVANPPDGSFYGGVQGGFLVENGGSVTGAAGYAVSLSKLLFPCNSGSATITGTVNGQGVWTLTAMAGTQTFVFTGALSSDNTTMSGTYTSTAGTAANGSPCGTAQTGLQWRAISVPELTGPLQGSFHSTGCNPGSPCLQNQDFPVTGSLTQGPNTGASSATLTGTLSFLNPATNLSDYPCVALAAVYGQISGNSVMLQVVGSGGSVIGQIGEPAGSYGSTGVNPATFDSATGGYILHGVQPTYMVSTSACPGNLASASTAGDFGNICLALNATSPCQEPIMLTPAALAFPALASGETAKQTTTLANNSSSTINGLKAILVNSAGSGNSFAETDNCGLNGAPSQGLPFDLISAQAGLPGWFCTITITFAAQCPPPPNPPAATLTVTSPVSADNDTAFAVPVTGADSCGAAVEQPAQTNHQQQTKGSR